MVSNDKIVINVCHEQNMRRLTEKGSIGGRTKYERRESRKSKERLFYLTKGLISLNARCSRDELLTGGHSKFTGAETPIMNERNCSRRCDRICSMSISYICGNITVELTINYEVA